MKRRTYRKFDDLSQSIVAGNFYCPFDRFQITANDDLAWRVVIGKLDNACFACCRLSEPVTRRTESTALCCSGFRRSSASCSATVGSASMAPI